MAGWIPDRVLTSFCKRLLSTAIPALVQGEQTILNMVLPLLPRMALERNADRVTEACLD